MPPQPEGDSKNLKSRMKGLHISQTRTSKKCNSQSRQIKNRHPLATGTGGGDVGTSGGGRTSASASTSASATASGSGRRGGMPPMTTPYSTRSSAGSSPPFPRPSDHSNILNPPHPRPPYRQRSRQHSRKPYQPTPPTSRSTDEIVLDSSGRRGRSQARKHSSRHRSHPTSAAFTSAARATEFVDTAETEHEFAEAARSRMVMQSSLLQGIKKNKLHPTLLTHLTLHHYQFRMDEWIEMMLLLPALQELDLDIASVVSVSVPTFFQEQESQHQSQTEMEIDKEATSERCPDSFWRRSRSTSSSRSFNSLDERMGPPEQQPLSSVFQFHSIRSLTFRGDKILPQLLEFLPNLEVLAFEEAQSVESEPSSSHGSNTNQTRQRTSAQGAQSDSESDSSTLNGGDANTNSPSRSSAVFVQLANTILERCPRLSRLVLNDPLMLVCANCHSDDTSLDTPQNLVPMHLFQNADNTAGAILAFPHTRRQNHELEYQFQQEQLWRQQLVQEQIQQDISLLFRAVPKLRSFVSHTRVVSLCPGLLDDLVAYHSSHLVSFQILDSQCRRPDIPQSHRPHHQLQPHVQPEQQPKQHHAFYSTDDTHYNPTRLSPPSDSLSLSPSPPPPPPPPLPPFSSSQPLPILPHAHPHHTDMPEPPYFPYEVQQQEALLHPQQYFYYEADAMSQSSGSPPLESVLVPAPMQYYHLTPFQVHEFRLQTYLLQQQQHQQFAILQQQQQQERQMQHQVHIQTLLCKSVLHVLESCPALACFETRIALPLQQIVDSVPSWLCRGSLQSLQLDIRELMGEGREDGGGLDQEEEEVMQLFVKSMFRGRNSMNNKQSNDSSPSSISSPSLTCSTPLRGGTDKREGRASALSPAMAQSSASDSTPSFDSASSLEAARRKRLSRSSNESSSSTPPPPTSPSVSRGTATTTTTDMSSKNNSLQHPPRPSSNTSRFRDDSGNDSGSDTMVIQPPVGVSSYQISSVGRLVGLQYLVEHQLTTLPRLEKFSLGNHEYRIPLSCSVRSQMNAV
ncbi:hypothetical protein BG005_008276 [Podila minutissima]|nr:hypothetical protein BG005_008276 [Podila minutissima]